MVKEQKQISPGVAALIIVLAVIIVVGAGIYFMKPKHHVATEEEKVFLEQHFSDEAKSQRRPPVRNKGN